ncbi:YaaC family protein [Streptomyces phaeochromogenes]|uniref:YaaC family protein n=1 Tax=Streptomyces phaeochromogenes TaxID=1923 RepID=UPI002E0EFAC0|nr:YaaC family protein [Streptomyces phaeochromogenes]
MYDSELMDGDVWGWLRRTRSTPPSPAAPSERRGVYTSALEQAEQFFRAARTVGPATRPLLIFYGLSQAGRAIAAASSNAKGDDWKLAGHGISQKKESLLKELPEVAVITEKSGRKSSFVRLSELLDSPLWENDVISLNELWDAIPENRDSPLKDTGRARRTPLKTVPFLMGGDPHPLLSLPIDYIPSWVVEDKKPREALEEYFVKYPSVAARDSYPWVGDSSNPIPRFEDTGDGWYSLTINWRMPSGQLEDRKVRRAYLETLTRPYWDRPHFFPLLGNNSMPLHPLMTWWAILHTLSVLVRYQPAEWASCIDVDHSTYAVPVEELLKHAMLVLPRLIGDTIDEVSGGGVKIG